MVEPDGPGRGRRNATLTGESHTKRPYNGLGIVGHAGRLYARAYKRPACPVDIVVAGGEIRPRRPDTELPPLPHRPLAPCEPRAWFDGRARASHHLVAQVLFAAPEAS